MHSETFSINDNFNRVTKNQEVLYNLMLAVGMKSFNALTRGSKLK